MTPARTWLLGLGLLLASGCRSKEPTPTSPVPPSSMPALASAVTSGALPAAPLRLGPAQAGTSEAREASLMAFVESGRARQLEVVATEPGEPLNRWLRQSLLEHVVGLGTLDSLPTGGRVKVGTPTVTGGEVANTGRVVAGMRASFLNCYQRVLAEAPNYAGRLDVRLSLDAEGAVEAAKATSSPQKNAAMVACVEARSRTAQFVPPSGNKSTTIAFSVLLGP